MTPDQILQTYFEETTVHLSESYLTDHTLNLKVAEVCRCPSNKAPIRLLMACLLGKIDNSKVDIRKPYTEISGGGTYSGRSYDEQYVEPFVLRHQLPTNSTTAFLTPALRNINRTLTTNLTLVGRPPSVYVTVLKLLDSVHRGQVTPQVLLKEVIRLLRIIQSENEERMKQLLKNLSPAGDSLPLSSDQIRVLLQQHLSLPRASRLPVLMVAAAYASVGKQIGEQFLPLESHNAADSQTGAFGDVEITLTNEHDIVTCYEMKDKQVTVVDIQHAVTKISNIDYRIHNYVFITTAVVDGEVLEYATQMYKKTGVEFVILDCMGFIRHFLHFFHRARISFLDAYQILVLNEPDSSVGRDLKEAWLNLRRTAETQNLS